jgi:hypothetical protein
MKFIWKVLDLKGERYWILSGFYHWKFNSIQLQKTKLKGKFSWVSIEFWVLFIIENSIKLQKMVSKGKFSWVTSSHLAQEQQTTLVII